MSPAEIKDPSGRVVLTLPLPFNELPQNEPVTLKVHGEDGKEIPIVVMLVQRGPGRLVLSAVECPELDMPESRNAFYALAEQIQRDNEKPSIGFAQPSPFDTNTVALAAIAGNYPDPIERTVHTSPRSKGEQRRREKPWNRKSHWR